MKTDGFIKLYKDRGYDDKAIDDAVSQLQEAEKFFKEHNAEFEEVTVDLVKKYVNYLIENDKNSLEALLAAARYFHLIKNNDVYIHFTKILGGLGVIENIKKRIEIYAGKQKAEEVMEGFTMPPLGTPIEEMPEYTKKLIKMIKAALEPDMYRKILAGNNHGVPKESMQLEKEFYQNSASIDDYLKERHQRRVEELQRYCDSDTVWFEQIITQDVVDFVAGNQEILSAKREGNKLYVTKIPYDIVNYLKETDKKKKNYYACHCTFARESIMSDEKNVDSEWCYCSAGFAKFPFEVIFDRELDIKLLKSALDYDDICRFEIDLGDYKK